MITKKFMKDNREKRNKFFQFSFFPENKRGDIPVMVLVIGVVALCFLTIMSFSIVIVTLNNSFYGIDKMNKMNVFIEEYSFYKNLGMDSQEIISFFENKEVKFEDNFMYLEEKDLDKIVFSVKYYLP